MIDMESIRFFMMLDTLSQLSDNGFAPISEALENGYADACIYFDDTNCIHNALNHTVIYKAVSVDFNADTLSEDDIIYWDDYLKTDSNYSVSVIDDGEEIYALVVCDDSTFVVKDGLFYEQEQV